MQRCVWHFSPNSACQGFKLELVEWEILLPRKKPLHLVCEVFCVIFTLLKGRLVCDTYLSAKEFLREKNYKLSELAKTQLNIKREDVESEEIPNYFQQASSLQKLLNHNENGAYIAITLMFKLMILPLTKQLTNLSGI